MVSCFLNGETFYLSVWYLLDFERYFEEQITECSVITIHVSKINYKSGFLSSQSSKWKSNEAMLNSVVNIFHRFGQLDEYTSDFYLI